MIMGLHASPTTIYIILFDHVDVDMFYKAHMLYRVLAHIWYIDRP